MTANAVRPDKSFKQKFDWLRGERDWLQLCWQEHEILYRTSQNRIASLDWGAPAFFRMTDKLLVETVILGIARLLDSSEMGGGRNRSGRGKGTRPPPLPKKNLVLAHLVELLEQQGLDPKRATELRKEIGTMKTRHKRLLTYRHKRIAHADLAIALGQEKLPKVLIKDVDGALKDIHSFLGKISAICERPEDQVRALSVLPASGSAEGLVSRLDRARSDLELRRHVALLLGAETPLRVVRKGIGGLHEEDHDKQIQGPGDRNVRHCCDRVSNNRASRAAS